MVYIIAYMVLDSSEHIMHSALANLLASALLCVLKGFLNAGSVYTAGPVNSLDTGSLDAGSVFTRCWLTIY